ncbi:MAG TPA: hypothetical protein DIV44_12535 [Leeuwenhoekiella sp.]|uniref:hypothetical protein n=1 Tax=Leeuwenhoekiella palythoae TaxID=573501 RepID=UPI000C5E194A|nr:hypothetical protein [Leeuwenhoekiella palythoae]MAS20927.1 hypothetical protein [Leeuwenhoekiella sp.]MEE3243604.1 hypothetical protein [Bacteroidota bacterium]MBH13108.1 hypothetical protein [Leeuwenhoekiella sp.]UBZ11521.1 hypothetical protein LDL79_05235 [Leeuwenhoekiella palythoae]HCQ77626.1 hypothetical protein [Leeuwenhoekiella sp.]|tara:strand:+ start:290 stop:511 length:222 start_codon:yes stop_codon:yes gene_type:complete
MKRFLLTVLFIVVSFSANAQCAMCRAVLESETDNSMAEGVNNGIIYLAAIPYLLMGGLIWFIYKSRKKANKGA